MIMDWIKSHGFYLYSALNIVFPKTLSVILSKNFILETLQRRANIVEIKNYAQNILQIVIKVNTVK